MNADHFCGGLIVHSDPPDRSNGHIAVLNPCFCMLWARPIGRSGGVSPLKSRSTLQYLISHRRSPSSLSTTGADTHARTGWTLAEAAMAPTA